MQKLVLLMKSKFNHVVIDFSNRNWCSVIVPDCAGWYYIETDTPVSVLQKLGKPQQQYKNKNGRNVQCKNYDIGLCAQRYSLSAHSHLFNTEYVYSGKAKSLKGRAKSHTFGHLGTACLNLSAHKILHSYQWIFHYLPSSKYCAHNPQDEPLLLLGEQIWRSINRWPILCKG